MNVHSAYWRQGRKVGRTVYAMVGSAPSDDDILIGLMDTPDLAHLAVDGHNLMLNLPKKDGTA